MDVLATRGGPVDEDTNEDSDSFVSSPAEIVENIVLTKRAVVASLWVVFAAAGVAQISGCASESGRAESLTVEDFRYQLLPSGARIVSGQVRNSGDDEIHNAQVQISLFDERNRRVSSMVVHVPLVGAGATARFREPVTVDEDVRGARVRSVIIL